MLRRRSWRWAETGRSLIDEMETVPAELLPFVERGLLARRRRWTAWAAVLLAGLLVAGGVLALRALH